jgi:sphingomyelin phosphodiesterase acid-like 3
MPFVARIRRDASGRSYSSRLRTCLSSLLPLLIFSSAAGQPATKNVAGRMLIASDVHFNPMADPSLVASLAASGPEQWETILERSRVTAFSRYGQDTNWLLLQSGLDAMARAEPHPALVMFTGDLLAHRFPQMFSSITHDSDPQHYRAFVLKTVEFVALEFRKRFVGAKILVTPGNNDDECGDYEIEADGEFLHDTAESARGLALEGEQFSATWVSLGSYRLKHPTLQGLRIVSLNTVFWSSRYRAASLSHGCATVNSTAAGDLFAWMETQLAEAERSHEKVWLMFHVPPGIDTWATTHPKPGTPAKTSTPGAPCESSVVPMWAPEWTERFDSVLQRYHSTVLASFAGHTHADDFRVIGGDAASPQFVLIDPAISPIYGQNPGFRIVDFRSDGTLADQTTYYLTNLEQAGGKTVGHWMREYRFSERWKVRQLDGASLATIYGEIASRNDARNLWWRLYTVSSSAVPTPGNDLKALYCAIGASTRQAYDSCYCAAATPAKQPQ